MTGITQKRFHTATGDIYYRTNTIDPGRQTLVFLHGLTADGRMFVKQAKAFADTFNLVIWDAPAHGKSRPFPLTFSYMDMAEWLKGILDTEGIRHPVLVGHSMGGYIAQCFLERYPKEAAGFVSIDSAPLQRKYLTAAELWLLEHVEPVFRLYPWKTLLRSGAKGNAVTPYGQRVVYKTFSSYTKDEFCALVGHGYRELAAAYKSDLPYHIDCKAMLLCGKNDRAGSSKSYNRRWAKQEGLPLHWIENAGHCANLDAPDEVNDLIRSFVTAYT